MLNFFNVILLNFCNFVKNFYYYLYFVELCSIYISLILFPFLFSSFIFQVQFVCIKMSLWGKGKKNVIVKLALELEIALDGSRTVQKTEALNTSDDKYDEDYIKSLFETILKDKEEDLDRKREELVRKENLETKNKRLETESEFKRTEVKLNFDQENLKIEKGVPLFESNS